MESRPNPEFIRKLKEAVDAVDTALNETEQSEREEEILAANFEALDGNDGDDETGEEAIEAARREMGALTNLLAISGMGNSIAEVDQSLPSLDITDVDNNASLYSDNGTIVEQDVVAIGCNDTNPEQVGNQRCTNVQELDNDYVQSQDRKEGTVRREGGDLSEVHRGASVHDDWYTKQQETGTITVEEAVLQSKPLDELTFREGGTDYGFVDVDKLTTEIEQNVGTHKDRSRQMRKQEDASRRKQKWQPIQRREDECAGFIANVKKTAMDPYSYPQFRFDRDATAKKKLDKILALAWSWEKGVSSCRGIDDDNVTRQYSPNY